MHIKESYQSKLRCVHVLKLDACDILRMSYVFYACMLESARWQPFSHLLNPLPYRPPAVSSERYYYG